MSVYPDDRRYSRSHEWIRVDGDVGTIGISDHRLLSSAQAPEAHGRSV